jgi:hypothetical protein
MTRGGLPHSDISGSKLICSSPELFAACHVLHRLLAPRHSPYTLSSLTIRNSRTNAVGSLAASRRTYCDSSHATLRVGSQVRLPHMETLCCGRKKLPFAEYSVVKDQPGGSPPEPPARSLGETPRPHSACLAGDSLRDTTVAKNTNYVGPPIGAPPAGFPFALPRMGPRLSSALTIGADVGARGDSTASLTHRKLFKEPSQLEIGGEYRARTGDLLVANQALSQLS